MKKKIVVEINGELKNLSVVYTEIMFVILHVKYNDKETKSRIKRGKKKIRRSVIYMKVMCGYFIYK